MIRGLGRGSFVWVVRRSCRQERDSCLRTARGCALGMEVVANRVRACGLLRQRWISQSCRSMSVGVGRGFRRFAAGIATGFSAGVSRRRVGFAADGGVRGVRVGRIAAAAPCGWRRVGSWCRALRDGGGTTDGVFANRARACGAYRRRGFRHAKVDGRGSLHCGHNS